MPLVVRNAGDPAVIHHNDLRAADLLSPELVEQAHTLHLPTGTAHLTHWYFEGIRMGYGEWEYTEPTPTHWQTDLDVVTLYFNLTGHAIFDFPQLGTAFSLLGQQHNLFYSTGFQAVHKAEALRRSSFMVQIVPEVFLRLTQGASPQLQHIGEQVAAGQSCVLSPQGLTVSLPLLAAIQAVRHCTLPKGLKKLFLFSKCLEIIALQADCDARSRLILPQHCKTDYDRERILFARDYLIQHIGNPPSLPTLARIAGLNEFKLKRGFREMFNNSLFGYLAEYRLEQARHQLLDTQKSITEIAFDLGYSSPQHFSTAFRKRFGVAPTGARG